MSATFKFVKWCAVFFIIFYTSIVSLNAKDLKVERIQRSLLLSGYDPGIIDGYWGNRTARALAEMAKDLEFAPIPRSKADLTPAVFRALDSAYQLYAETQELNIPHLQDLMTITDARHLLERSGIGAHPKEILEILGLTRSAAITAITKDLSKSTISITPPEFLTTPQLPEYWIRWDYEEERRQQFRVARDEEMGKLRKWWIQEMIATPNPQSERLILLWHNHFVTAYSGIQEEVHAIARQHWTFRELGHTNFRDLTRALVRDAAMLNYLDNDRSRKEQPNENLARELMELFVLGEGNYTEQTVKDVARALTGYSYNRMRHFEFEFKPWDHDNSVKNVLGRQGRFNGDNIVDILLAQPAAANFVASKFWNVYISDFNEDPEEIKRIANVFRKSDFDIKVLLRETLASEAFWAEDNRATIVKSPIDLMIGSIRSTGNLPDWWASLPNRLASIGQNLFEAPNVAGWPGGADWMTPSRLLMRGEMVMDIVSAQSLSNDVGNATILPATMASLPMVLNNEMVSAPQPQPQPQPEPEPEPQMRKVFIRYAAEDFEGAALFRIIAMGQEEDGISRLQWRSPLVEAEGGIDTARFGRVEDEDLPWRIATIEMPSSVEYDSLSVEFINDHCCGPGGSDGGDRNLFIDWVVLDDRLYLAEDGKQTSTFGGCGKARPGKMYCSARLFLTKFQSIEPDESKNIKTSDDIQDSTLLVDRVAFEWSERLDLNDDWSSFTFGLLHPSSAGISVDGMQLRIVRNRQDNGWRVLLQLEERSCFPSCLGGQMPPSADMNANGEKNVQFVLIGAERQKERAQWNQLTDTQRAFVSALWMSIPEILEESRNGRNWRERGAEKNLKSWQPIFDAIERTLPKSRYAKVKAKGGLKIEERNKGAGMMMSMMADLKNTSPQKIAGINIDEAEWSVWRPILGVDSPSNIFLAAEPVTSSPTSVALTELLLDPVFNLK